MAKKHKYIVLLEVEDGTPAGPQEDRLEKILKNCTASDAISDALDCPCRIWLPSDAEIAEIETSAPPLPLPQATIEGPELVCPACGSRKFHYVEDVQAVRDVELISEEAIVLDGSYETRDDGAENAHLECGICCAAYALPPGMNTEFV
jgi:hypothetical protein